MRCALITAVALYLYGAHGIQDGPDGLGEIAVIFLLMDAVELGAKIFK
ncbi:hypothetical protein [Vibrio harveyi]|nr:hypothetical protein [Vibrio harveyi]